MDMSNIKAFFLTPKPPARRAATALHRRLHPAPDANSQARATPNTTGSISSREWAASPLDLLRTAGAYLIMSRPCATKTRLLSLTNEALCHAAERRALLNHAQLPVDAQTLHQNVVGGSGAPLA